MTPAETGRAGEDAAADFLEAAGLRVMDRNYRFGREEVDLACLDPEDGMIVIVEVKARRGDRFGPPEAAVDAAKQKAIMRVTEAYLHERRLMPALVRFDVVAVTFARDGAPQVEHFRNAFGHFV